MKGYIFILLVAGSISMHAQQGYKIDISLKPYKNEKIYLGYYYGKLKALADSVILNENSKGNFIGKEPLHGGIYFIVSPRKEILFEILIDKDQDFTILLTQQIYLRVYHFPDRLTIHSFSVIQVLRTKQDNLLTVLIWN